MKAMVDAGHTLGLRVGWYGNNCMCHDTCTSTVCFAGDVNATVAFGFDSIKLDGCGQEEDVALWSAMFNHTLRMAGGTGGGEHGIMIENCHNGLLNPVAPKTPNTPNTADADADADADAGAGGKVHAGAVSAGGKVHAGAGGKVHAGSKAHAAVRHELSARPYYDAHGELVCPFHMYRSSTDIRPVYAYASRAVQFSILPPWGSIRFRLAPRTYDAPPCGPSVLVLSQAKSRKLPTRKILPRSFVIRYGSMLVNLNTVRTVSRSIPPEWGVNSIPPARLHVRPMGVRRTCR